MFLCQGISIQRDLSKSRLRSILTDERDALPEEIIETKSRIIQQKLLDSVSFKESSSILVYCGIRSEVRTDFLIRESLREGKKVYCPVSDKRKTVTDPVTGMKHKDSGVMEFYRIFNREDLKEGLYGIPEPDPKESIQYTADDCDKSLLIMPGIAFDSDRNRIGYGGGYYDRYLHSHPSIHTAALAFDLQIVEHIPAEEQDIRPQLIITESRVI